MIDAMISDLVRKISHQLQSHSESPQLDAELLVAAIIHCSRAQLFTHPERELTSLEQKKLEEYVRRRCLGEPIAYLLGYKEFWSLEMKVTPDVLIPRPETEMLVEWALNHLPADKPLRIADLGTGSGAVAIALAHARPNWFIDATENSKSALQIAQENATRHAVSNVKFYLGSWCEALPHHNYHAIVANPPYIAEQDAYLQDLKFEPHEALVAGKEGLDAIKLIIVQAKNYLQKKGYLVLEHGYDQNEAIIQKMKENHYTHVKDYHDLANLPRMIVGCNG